MGLAEALKGTDVFIGLSAPGIVTRGMVAAMGRSAVVFAMANPVPEIMPSEALAAGAAVVGSGRSDFPNQINNVLAFPGIFRGALDSGATRITTQMKLSAAEAIASLVKRPTARKILPGPLDRKVARAVARAVAGKAARA